MKAHSLGEFRNARQTSSGRRATAALVVGLLLVTINFDVGGAEPLQDYNNDGKTDILWRHKIAGQNGSWFMSGLNHVGTAFLTYSDGSQVINPDANWKMVGTGDFDGNAGVVRPRTDILWQYETTDQVAVWRVNGTVFQQALWLNPQPGDANWRVVATADFNRDGHTDIVWQNTAVSPSANAIWFMNGVNLTSAKLLPSNGDPNWKIVGAGDFDTDQNNVSYGIPDLVLWNYTTGQSGIWFMYGFDGTVLHRGEIIPIVQYDQDWKMVQTLDMNVDTALDLAFRHATLGTHASWFLNGSVLLGTSYFDHAYDTDWRVATQPVADSYWRLERELANSLDTYLHATLSVSPPQVTLTYKFNSSGGGGIAIHRRLAHETTWPAAIVTQNESSYTDTTVQAGQRYEYKLYRLTLGGAQVNDAELLTVALDAPPIESRGRIILLVDADVASSLTTQLDQLKKDLIGDGWTVVSANVARHNANAWLPNGQGSVVGIKNTVLQLYNQDPLNTKAILIIGHVAVPYSGTAASDGHTCSPLFGPDHSGAWAADLYYADVDATWTDNTANVDNCNYPLNDNFINDGKFDQNYFQAEIMKISVGRIDFARLPAFGTSSDDSSSANEITLLQSYLTKSHNYRHKLFSWQAQSHDRAIAYSWFDLNPNLGLDAGPALFHNAMQSSGALFGTTTGKLSVGDYVLQPTKSYLVGFVAGNGTWTGINTGVPNLQYYSSSLANQTFQPTAAFCMLTASFMGDWYAENNNFVRSLLTVPNYGVASLWTASGGLWRLDCLGIGEHLGMSLVRMINSPRGTIASTAKDRLRELVVQGDPTLRAHVLAPPSNLQYLSGELRWTGNEAGVIGYYVYEATSSSGPFTRISANAVTGTSFPVGSAPSTNKVYMVKALKSISAGNGSYRNLSQGAFIP